MPVVAGDGAKHFVTVIPVQGTYYRNQSPKVVMKATSRPRLGMWSIINHS